MFSQSLLDQATLWTLFWSFVCLFWMLFLSRIQMNPARFKGILLNLGERKKRSSWSRDLPILQVLGLLFTKGRLLIRKVALIQSQQEWWVTKDFAYCFSFTEIFAETSYCLLRAQHRDTQLGFKKAKSHLGNYVVRSTELQGFFFFLVTLITILIFLGPLQHIYILSIRRFFGELSAWI